MHYLSWHQVSLCRWSFVLEYVLSYFICLLLFQAMIRRDNESWLTFHCQLIQAVELYLYLWFLSPTYQLESRDERILQNQRFWLKINSPWLFFGFPLDSGQKKDLSFEWHQLIDPFSSYIPWIRFQLLIVPL